MRNSLKTPGLQVRNPLLGHDLKNRDNFKHLDYRWETHFWVQTPEWVRNSFLSHDLKVRQLCNVLFYCLQIQQNEFNQSISNSSFWLLTFNNTFFSWWLKVDRLDEIGYTMAAVLSFKSVTWLTFMLSTFRLRDFIDINSFVWHYSKAPFTPVYAKAKFFFDFGGCSVWTAS